MFGAPWHQASTADRYWAPGALAGQLPWSGLTQRPGTAFMCAAPVMPHPALVAHGGQVLLQ